MPKIQIRGGINKRVVNEFKEWLNGKGYIQIRTLFSVEHRRFVHLISGRVVVLYRQRQQKDLVGYAQGDALLVEQFIKRND